jgi:hypothetical protein
MAIISHGDIIWRRVVDSTPCIILYLFPTWYTILFRLYTVSGFPLFSTCFRPYRPIIRRSKLYIQPVVLSPSADVFVVWPLRKNFNYNLDLLMMGLWGLKHVEERGNPGTVYRRKTIVYQVGNKDKINYTEMYGQQNIKTLYYVVEQWIVNALSF